MSNYGGDARLYLENLIEACGAKFTKSMKTENTHLITARFLLPAPLNTRFFVSLTRVGEAGVIA